MHMMKMWKPDYSCMSSSEKTASALCDFQPASMTLVHNWEPGKNRDGVVVVGGWKAT